MEMTSGGAEAPGTPHSPLESFSSLAFYLSCCFPFVQNVFFFLLKQKALNHFVSSGSFTDGSDVEISISVSGGLDNEFEKEHQRQPQA